MTTCPEDSRRMVTAEVTLESSDWHLQARMTVPAGPTRLRDMLPLARALSDAVVGETIKAVEQLGEQVSCKAGCGACCRQLVPISEVEARRLREVVEGFPEPRRSEVRARFAAARKQLAEAGLLPQLQHAEQWTDADYQSLAEAYFAQRIACPFLEDESCSIYAERPITCREYLVTSPAAHCARPTPETIRRVRIPLPVFNAVARWQVPPSTHFLERWVPLTLAPEWAETHAEDPSPQPGVDLLRALLDCLTGRDTSPTQAE